MRSALFEVMPSRITLISAIIACLCKRKPHSAKLAKNFSMQSRHRLPFDRAFISLLQHVVCVGRYEWAKVMFPAH